MTTVPVKDLPGVNLLSSCLLHQEFLLATLSTILCRTYKDWINQIKKISSFCAGKAHSFSILTIALVEVGLTGCYDRTYL